MSASAVVTAAADAGDTPVTITATDGAIQKNVAVTVVSRWQVAGVDLAATGAFPGETVSGTVSLTLAAPAGGLVVTLSSSTPDVTVPASVTVPAGSASAPFVA